MVLLHGTWVTESNNIIIIINNNMLHVCLSFSGSEVPPAFQDTSGIQLRNKTVSSLFYLFIFLGKKWIYLEKNTLHRQSVGHLRR